MVRVITLGLPSLIEKCRSIFPRVFPPVSDWSVWHDENTLYFKEYVTDIFYLLDKIFAMY